MFPYGGSSAGETSSLGFWDILDLVVNSPSPAMNTACHSPEFIDFVTRCLEKDPKRRMDAHACLRHPFIQKHEAMGEKALQWVAQMSSEQDEVDATASQLSNTSV